MYDTRGAGGGVDVCGCVRRLRGRRGQRWRKKKKKNRWGYVDIWHTSTQTLRLVFVTFSSKASSPGEEEIRRNKTHNRKHNKKKTGRRKMEKVNAHTHTDRQAQQQREIEDETPAHTKRLTTSRQGEKQREPRSAQGAVQDSRYENGGWWEGRKGVARKGESLCRRREGRSSSRDNGTCVDDVWGI